MLTFSNNTIIQKTSWYEKVWTIPELLESQDPLPGEPIAERIAAMQKAAQLASHASDELSELTKLSLDFWTNFQAQKLAWHASIFKMTVDEKFHWELKISESGIFFKDVSGQYDRLEEGVTEQLFSDFWLFGPRRPIPDLSVREKVLNLLKNGFVTQDCPSAKAPFEFFAYPDKPVANLHWEEGNYVRSDFVSVRNFGIETGHTTFRDGMFGPGFLSFERFLNIPPAQLGYITPEMREKIEAYLGKTSTFNPAKPAETGPKLLSPREKMDLAESLLQDPNSTEGAEILISLLEYEAESDYWRNYVFNRCCRLRKNPKVQNFIASCLQADDEIWFKKASDVIGFWCLQLGEKALADKGLLFALNWEYATTNDPEFRAALEKTLKIIFSPPS